MNKDTQSNKAKEIGSAISRAQASYHKIVIVAGKSGSEKTPLLHLIARQFQIPFLNLGLALSQKLLNLTSRQRRIRTADIIAEIVEDHIDDQSNPRLIVDNTEIIFEPSLKLNPFGLLRSICRKRLLIWSWNGVVDQGHLVYAYPGHPEYQQILLKDLITVNL